MATDQRAANLANFWRAIELHDWPLLESSLRSDFVRSGLRGDEDDTCRSAAEYVGYVSDVLDRVYNHTLELRRISYSEDGRLAVVETTESIQVDPGSAVVPIRMTNLFEFDEAGEITRLDMYSKRVNSPLPDWVTDYDGATA